MFKAFRETGKGKQIMKECLELCFTEMSLLGRKCVGNVPVPRSLPPITLCGWDGWLEDRLEASPFLDLLGLNTFQMSLLSPVRWVCGFQVRLWRNSVKYLDHILIAPKSRARSHIREVWPQSLPSGELPGMGSPDGSQSIHRNFISLVFTLDMVLLPLKKKLFIFGRAGSLLLCTGFSLVVASGDHSLVAVSRLLTAVVSLVAVRGF